MFGLIACGVVVVLVALIWRLTTREGSPIDGRGKGILVTGAASGIGLSTSKLLFERGCHVYATDLSEDALRQSFAKELSSQGGAGTGRITIMKMDVTKDDDVRAVRQVIESNGDFYGLLNNAGIAPSMPNGVPKGIDELDVSSPSARLIWDINVFGVLRVTHHFADLLPDDGVVASLASVAGIVAGPFFGYYSATKFAVVSIMDSLRRENLTSNKRFVTVCPGFTNTPLLNDMRHTGTVDASHSRHHKILSSTEMKTRRQTFLSAAQPVEVVSRQIVERALLRNNPVPVLVIDGLVARILWWMAPILPRRFFDAIMRSGFSK